MPRHGCPGSGEAALPGSRCGQRQSRPAAETNTPDFAGPRASWSALEAPWRAAIEMAWLAIAPCLNTSGALLRAMERTAPRNIALARAVHSRYQETAHLPGTAAQALEDAWDLLTGSTR